MANMPNRNTGARGEPPPKARPVHTATSQPGREDGVGPVKTARDARQGYWDSPVLGVLFMSLLLALIAFAVLMIWLNV